MLQIITGKRGEGKTTKMISLANEESKRVTGDVVYINSSKRRRYDLSYRVRLIEPLQFDISTPEQFFGFVAGIISANHDTQVIFVDELFRLTGLSLEEMSEFISRLRKLSDKYNVRFVISATCAREDFPVMLEDYLIAQ